MMRRCLIVLTTTFVLLAATASTASAHHHKKLKHWYNHSGAKCVHQHEGAWTSNTGNGYYGGYQMSLWFQITYAPRRYAVAGTADHWTRWHQIAVTRRVVRSSGWGQWPNTAAACGLL